MMCRLCTAIRPTSTVSYHVNPVRCLFAYSPSIASCCLTIFRTAAVRNWKRILFKCKDFKPYLRSCPFFIADSQNQALCSISAISISPRIKGNVNQLFFISILFPCLLLLSNKLYLLTYLLTYLLSPSLFYLLVHSRCRGILWFHLITLRHTQQSVGFLWTRDRPVAETSTWQHKHCTRDKHQCPRWDSNPWSQQALGRRPTP
jgi:hypothetical protein